MQLKIFILLILPFISLQLDNGVGLTPIMGYSPLNKFKCASTEALIKQAAGILQASGLKNKGYTYISIEDCW